MTPQDLAKTIAHKINAHLTRLGMTIEDEPPSLPSRFPVRYRIRRPDLPGLNHFKLYSRKPGTYAEYMIKIGHPKAHILLTAFIPKPIERKNGTLNGFQVKDIDLLAPNARIALITTFKEVQAAIQRDLDKRQAKLKPGPPNQQPHAEHSR